MVKKVLIIMAVFIMLLHPKIISADTSKYIEIFDPKQDKVVKMVETNKEINNMIIDWINKIDKVYAKVDPIKDDEYAIRFPLNSAIQVQNKWLDTTVEEVYLIVPKNDLPFFMIFETENKLVCFPFTGEIKILSNILDFRLR
ncbi:hypothetical protein RBU61_17715 [Tissierella sp. MB52-C2]|uniref:hypothetical protein n=1 Tax=Tissierella sp. MB52-C2 TaxID=3070999 RepID=UPI00280BC935|nr:hypothetical protein [Tissierella sp. MB52-C2]WMM24739.1 hypothetical protein RBU61_17715 [Tissierella sp. MB52-C2]